MKGLAVTKELVFQLHHHSGEDFSIPLVYKEPSLETACVSNQAINIAEEPSDRRLSRKVLLGAGGTIPPAYPIICCDLFFEFHLAPNSFCY